MAKQNFYNLTFEELKTFLAEKVGIEKGKVVQFENKKSGETITGVVESIESILVES